MNTQNRRTSEKDSTKFKKLSPINFQGFFSKDPDELSGTIRATIAFML